MDINKSDIFDKLINILEENASMYCTDTAISLSHLNYFNSEIDKIIKLIEENNIINNE